MARVATLNVSLTEPLRDYVRKRVSSGKYESASEVVRDGLRALQERERAASAFWSDVRAQVAEAKRQVAAGDVVDGEQAMGSIIDELAPAPRRKSKRARGKR